MMMVICYLLLQNVDRNIKRKLIIARTIATSPFLKIISLHLGKVFGAIVSALMSHETCDQKMLCEIQDLDTNSEGK